MCNQVGVIKIEVALTVKPYFNSYNVDNPVIFQIR